MYNPFSLGKWRPVIYRQPKGVQDVALTFDDGPHPATTPVILDLLRRHDATATFFFTGTRCDAHPDLVARVVDEGHVVFGHGWEHINFEYAEDTEMLSSMERVEALLRQFRPTPDVYLVRLPYNAGCKRSRIHALTKRFHPDTRFASWAITTRDWMLARGCFDRADLDRRCSIVADEIEKDPLLPGALVLMHEVPFGAEGSLSPYVAETLLPKILQALDRRRLKAGHICLCERPSVISSFFCWQPGTGQPIRSIGPELDYNFFDRFRRKLADDI